MNREKAYALYRGEKFLGIGTKKELAELLGVKVETISFYGTPAYKKRTNQDKARRLVCIDQEEQMAIILTLSDIIALLFGLVWLIGLILAGLVFFVSRGKK